MKNYLELDYSENIDSIHLKIMDMETLKIIDDYIEEENLDKRRFKNSNNKWSRWVIKKDETILFSYYKQTFKDHYVEDYIMIEVHGLKKYSTADTIKQNYLTKLLVKLTKEKKQYFVQRLDYSIDINQKTEHIFLYKNSKGSKPKNS